MFEMSYLIFNTKSFILTFGDLYNFLATRLFLGGLSPSMSEIELTSEWSDSVLLLLTMFWSSPALESESDKTIAFFFWGTLLFGLWDILFPT